MDLDGLQHQVDKGLSHMSRRITFACTRLSQVKDRLKPSIRSIEHARVPSLDTSNQVPLLTAHLSLPTSQCVDDASRVAFHEKELKELLSLSHSLLSHPFGKD